MDRANQHSIYEPGSDKDPLKELWCFDHKVHHGKNHREAENIELYDELDEKIIDALTIDPKVHWSYNQRKAVKALIKARDEQREMPSVNIFGTWISIDMGAEVRFEPMGMWGQRVWQNGATYVCSGKRKNEDCDSITDAYDYRFTQIGSGSVGKEYNDVFITGKDIKRWYDDGAQDDLKNLSGWFTLTQKTSIDG